MSDDTQQPATKKTDPEKVSVLEEVDFELSLIQRDEINVAYILNLLVNLKNLPPEEAKKRQKAILDMLAGEVQLRSKRKLIEAFIEENLPKLKPDDNVITEFETYWTQQRQKAFEQLCADEKIEPANFDKLLQNYVFANRLPRDQEIVESLSFKPKILERKSILERIGDKIQAFIHTYVEGMGGSV